ncbi:MAG: response regulator transcription factor [Gammaproteobacteria bacterium]|nr:response regulator transcription factor [Gammaproteobacteria bacterium]
MSLLAQKTLLYAEDDVVTLNLYEHYFKKHFKRVYTAINGKRALDLYKDKDPDVVILDVNMPVINGLEVCKAIRKKDKQTKLILLTAHSDKLLLMEAIGLGLTAYLEKPVNPTQLKEAFKKIYESDFDLPIIKLWHHNKQIYMWNNEKQELYVDTEIIALTKKEKNVLEVFITSKYDKLSYQQLYNRVWIDENKEFSEVAIKTIIKGLRSKLPPNSIVNVYGLGYFLNKS